MSMVLFTTDPWMHIAQITNDECTNARYVHGPIPLGQHHVSPGQHHVGRFSSISRAAYQKDRLAIPSCVNPLNVWLYTGVHVFTHTTQPITCDAHSALMPHQRKSVLPSSHQTLSALSLHCPVSRPPPRLLWIEQTQADRRTHTHRRMKIPTKCGTNTIILKHIKSAIFYRQTFAGLFCLVVWKHAPHSS